MGWDFCKQASEGPESTPNRPLAAPENEPVSTTRTSTSIAVITLDPDTAIANPEVLRKVTREHDGTAGVYGAVLAEGMIRAGDPVESWTEQHVS
jgi:hypothetical protein